MPLVTRIRSAGSTALWVTLLFALAVDAHAQLPQRLSFSGNVHQSSFGFSVSGGGDVNGDGFDDVIVGAPLDDPDGSAASGPVDQGGGPPPPKGSARVYSGIDGTLLYTFIGDDFGDQFGFSVSHAGDVNGDGFDDLIVGAKDDDNNGTSSGSARVFSGVDGSTLYTFNGTNGLDYFGFSVSGAGDANGDGFDDLIVGAYGGGINGTNSGSATLFSGADGSVLFSASGDGPNDFFGIRVRGTGDVNGDGFDDCVVGAPNDDNNGLDSGSVRVLSGFDGSALYSFDGDSPQDRFGNAVSGAGDVNNDGFADFIVGADGDDDNGPQSGSARVFSGFDGSVLLSFFGDISNALFGSPVSGAGDVNGDGFDDLVVGTVLSAGSMSVGSALVYSGFDGSLLAKLDSDDYGGFIGFASSVAGDVNGDGLDDIVLGAPTDKVNNLIVGGARVFSLAGSRTYGIGSDAAQTLSCGWTSSGTAGSLAAGNITVTGASAFGTGILGLSIGPAQAPFLSTTLLIDVNPGNFLTYDICFDVTGSYVSPVNLQNPPLAGRSFFLQVAEANGTAPQGAFSSNGLELLFTH
jgi:FG-GAP repeat